MAENSNISWTDHTFNPWIGCTNVGPGCDHCYAEKLSTTRLGVEWGAGKPRRRTAPGNWAKVRKWNREADAFRAEHGHWPRVFSASLADIFDNEIDPTWRADFWALVKATPKLQWLIVTKRVPNVERMLPADWSAENYPHVVLIITVINQPEADRDIPRLLAIKVKYPWLLVGLSIEPMLGPINLRRIRCKDFVDNIDRPATLYPLDGRYQIPDCHWSQTFVKLDWIITGGESKQLEGKRPLVPLQTQWVRDIAAQCSAAGVPHHFKQWGYTIPTEQTDDPVARTAEAKTVTVGADHKPRIPWKDGMGRMLDGVEHNGFPPQNSVLHQPKETLL